jgi:hypothetical protein
MNCPNGTLFALVDIFQFDPPGYQTDDLLGGFSVVQFVFPVEVFGKDFGMETIVLIDPGSKLHGFVNDLFVFLLLDGQDYGAIMSLGWLPCRSAGHDSPLRFAKNKGIMTFLEI